MARPSHAQDSIDKEELEKLMQLYPNRKEAADWFSVSESSLERFIKNHFQLSFEALRDKSFTKTKVAIKRAQISKALKGDNTMMIWVGKQYLGQSDKVDQNAQVTHIVEQMKHFESLTKQEQIENLQRMIEDLKESK